MQVKTQCGHLSWTIGMTYSILLWHKHFCVKTNVVGGFGWPGNSLNELNLIYILIVEHTLLYNTEPWGIQL